MSRDLVLKGKISTRSKLFQSFNTVQFTRVIKYYSVGLNRQNHLYSISSESIVILTYKNLYFWYTLLLEIDELIRKIFHERKSNYRYGFETVYFIQRLDLISSDSFSVSGFFLRRGLVAKISSKVKGFFENFRARNTQNRVCQVCRLTGRLYFIITIIRIYGKKIDTNTSEFTYRPCIALINWLKNWLRNKRNSKYQKRQ